MNKTAFYFVLLSIQLVSISCSVKKEKHIAVPGIIFTQIQSDSIIPFRGKNNWTPAEEQINDLEELLPTYINSEEFIGPKSIINTISTYKRQYFGTTVFGEKLIIVNGISDISIINSSRWRSEFVEQAENGFIVIFNPIKHEFVTLPKGIP